MRAPGTPADIWALLPVKAFARAKQRLARGFDAPFRRRLAETMVEDVLDALARAQGLAGILVVTDDPAAAALARRYAAQTFDGPGTADGHTAAVLAGIAELTRRGVGGILALPGDIPGITPAEVAALLARHRAPDRQPPAFTIVPAHDRRGSNAILATPPNAVPLAYGDDSFLPHLATARRHGITPLIMDLPGIALDVDHPEDLAALRATGWSTRTNRLLATTPEPVS